MKSLKHGGWLCNNTLTFWLFMQAVVLPHPVFSDSEVSNVANAIEKGEFAIAIRHWKTSLATLDQAERVPVLLQIAQAYLRMGQIQEAYDHLRMADAISRRIGNSRERLQVLGLLSDVHLVTRDIDQALVFAEKSTAIAQELKDDEMLASAFNQLGNVLMAKHRYQAALDSYQEAISLSDALDDKDLSGKLRINAVYALLANDVVDQAIAYLQHSLMISLTRADSYDKALDLIAIGYLFQQIIYRQEHYSDTLQEPTYRAYQAALAIANASQNKRLQSYAYGHLGELYLSSGKLADAEILLRQGVFASTEKPMPELSARWYWQLGRLKRALKQNNEAIALYKHAVFDLESVEPALIYGYRGKPGSFRDNIGTIYLELVELLLQQSVQSPVIELQQLSLTEAKRVMEQFKTFELKNYFQDDCVTELQSKLVATDVDKALAENTAVFYPIILPKRIITLVSFHNGQTKRFETVVSSSQLTQTALAFREQLLHIGNPRRLRNLGLQLYEWLIEPIQQTLSELGVDTIVIVPDDILRAIPYAALFDGKDFLVTKYALAVTPGLSLTNTARAHKTNNAILLTGLSDPVQQFTALPFVTQEITKIADVYANHTLLLNTEFKKANVKRQLSAKAYSTAVFSTHAHLAADPKQSFLLTYDNKISLDELEQFIRQTSFHEQALDLLVLSACETASGDERAWLGLAGMAVKSGANSVLASLWPVNDASTAELVPTFFQHLNHEKVSKAKALQLAQKKLMATQQYRHPYFWAGFVMIGEWQ